MRGFTDYTSLYKLQTTVLSIDRIPRSGTVGSWSTNIFNFNRYCQITFQKGCSTFQPIANTGWCQSLTSFALLPIWVRWEAVECIFIVVLICMIPILVSCFKKKRSHRYLLLAFPPVFAEGVWGLPFGDAGRSEPVPCGEDAGLGSGYSDTVQSPSAPRGHSVPASSRRGWAWGSWLESPRAQGLAQGRGIAGCRQTGPQPDCASRAPSLCTTITREMPAGTLRKVGGPGPAQTGRGEGAGSICCRSPGRPRLAPSHDHRGDWPYAERQGCR